MKNIFSKTTEKRTQNGVKSYLCPTFVLYTISIFTFLTLGVGKMWAGDNCDFLHKEADDVWIKYVTDAGTTTQNIKDNGQSDISLGSKTNLSISEFRAITKKHDGNVCHVKMHYGINTSRDGSTGSNVQAGYNNDGYGDWTWDNWWSVQQFKNTSVGIDLIRNRKPGNYYFDFYFTINGNSGGSSGCYDNQKYWDNNGGHYHISYTIPDPTITISGASSLVAGTSTNITATISNYPVGATLTNLQVSGNIASTKSNTGSGSSITINSVVPNASGSNGITVTATVTFGSAGTKDYTYKYNVTPPAVSDFTISATSGSLGGSGTSENPWLVTYNGSLILGLSGATKAYADGDASPQYSTDGTNYGTTGSYISQTHSSITATTNQNWTYKARLKNNSSALYGSVKEKTVYWKVSTSSVTLHKNGGSSNGSATATHGRNTLASISAPSKTGYNVEGYYTNEACTTKVATSAGALQASTTYTTSGKLWNVLGAQTLYTKWSPKQYTLTLNKNSGSANGSIKVTYDSNSTSNFTPVTRTGYNCTGYWTSTSGGNKIINPNGTLVAYSASVSSYINSLGNWIYDGSPSLNAQWTPKQSTLTFDYQSSAEGYSADGTLSSVTATYNAAMPALSGSLPTAANGYAFMGFYDAVGGGGTRYYDGSGNSVHTWDKNTESGTTLYAYFKKAEITALAFDNAIVAPGNEVGVTPTVEPTPTGDTKICWRLLHGNGNPLEEEDQPTFTFEDGKLTFPASSTSGTYLIEAKLRTGSSCDAGTVLDSVTASFQVAGDHTVAVQYKCGDEFIKASTSVAGRPLAWSESITAPDIFGYYFSEWEAIDGVTISTDGTNPIVGSTTTTKTIYIKAVYDGKIVAKYNKKDFIYFKNTLGWNNNNIYVYFYKDGGYWDESNGAGATGDACIGKGKMSLVDGETDILYWDYGAGITGGAAAATKYIAFTAGNGTSHENFNGFDVVYPYNGNVGHQGFNPGTPMFVPLAKSVQPNPNYKKNGNTPYFDRGYWTKYSGGTGYSIDIFFSKGGSYDKSVNFVAGETPDMPYTATVDLSGSRTLGFKIHRANSIYYYSANDVTTSNAATAKDLTFDSGASNQTGITTTAAGEYTFTLTCAATGELQISVKYPVAAGDYRVIYKDGVHTGWKPSAVVPKVNNGKDTVSFFIRPGNNPEMKIQQASIAGNTLTWNNYSTVTSSTLTSLPQDSVYNVCLTMNGTGAISVENVEAYTGNFYIRTDAANNKWDNYKAADHMMTYSEYSEHNSDFSHYWMAHVTATSSNKFSVKYVVANDYSPCISDTLIRSTYRGGDSYHVDASGFISVEANIRFMWKRHTNEVYRAYLAPAQSDGSKFLVLRGSDSDNLLDVDGNNLRDASNNNHLGGDHCMQFVDDENWIYETTVKVIPSTYVKLFALFNTKNFYYKGANNNTFNGYDSGDGYHTPNAIQLITGSGDAQLVRVIYDFKTDRLVAAYLPSGNITEDMDINADVMFIREHQGDIAQLTFNSGKKLTTVKTAYAVMRFNKWTLNNKSKAAGHAPLDPLLSRYERDLFYISFPFRVNLNEVFGFGTYGKHWIIQYYDGEDRAKKGFWKDSPTFWKFVTNRNGFYLEPNVGYLLALDLEELGEESTVWNNRVENVELFFPSTGDIGSITTKSVTHTLPAHTCTIIRAGSDRTIADSHWNIMSVPTYVNVNNPSYASTTWTNAHPRFLYTWNMDDNTLTPTTAAGFMYHAMHAYTVQYYGNVTWTASTTNSIVARELQAPTEYEWCLVLQQNEKMIDRTYVRMSDEEEVTTGFEFGYDMSKDLNRNKANIYSYIGSEMVAGNSMPLDAEQTTIVPLGVVIASNGEYTFSIPDGTNGIGITLIDEETGIRTSLSALDYTVELAAGDYTERFWLEISPVKGTETGIDPGVDARENGVRKVMIDGLLYIVRDGKMFDATGKRVE